MRIAWVVAYPIFGGPHNHLATIAAPLRTLGVEATLVVPDEPGNALTRAAAEQVDVVSLPLHRMRATRSLGPHFDFAVGLSHETARLARVLRGRRIDVVVQATLVPPHGAIAARRAGLPLVWQIVDTGSPPPIRDASMALVRRWSDHVMFCGGRLVSLHVGDRPLHVPYEVFYPPVDTERFRPSRELRAATRAKWNIPSESPVVGMVGNLNPQKGWEYFVRAAALIHRRLPDVRFMMVGASSPAHQNYVDRVEYEMARSGVPRQHFVMTGDSREVEALLPAFDLKLMTSRLRSEGTPTSALEALACGVPVVGVDVGAVAEVIQDGVTGYLARPLDPTDIAEKAMRLLSDPDLRASVARTCRQRATDLYDARGSARQHMVAFEQASEFYARRRNRGRGSIR